MKVLHGAVLTVLGDGFAIVVVTRVVRQVGINNGVSHFVWH
jgi:hypothetical protein